MARLVLIRHGQASYGQADYDRLSPRGEEQARTLGPHLASLGLDALFVGPLRRQQQTAQYAREAAGGRLPAHDTLAELAEYPAYEMLQHLVPRLIAEDPQFEQLTSAPTPRLLDQAFNTILRKWSRDEWTVDGVERVDAFVGRIRAGLDRVLRAAGVRDQRRADRRRGRPGVRDPRRSHGADQHRDPQRVDHRAPVPQPELRLAARPAVAGHLQPHLAPPRGAADRAMTPTKGR
jgi:broad specificity phosphatase PhoE